MDNKAIVTYEIRPAEDYGGKPHPRLVAIWQVRQEREGLCRQDWMVVDGCEREWAEGICRALNGWPTLAEKLRTAETRQVKLQQLCLDVRDAVYRAFSSRLQKDRDELDGLVAQCNTPDLLDLPPGLQSQWLELTALRREVNQLRAQLGWGRKYVEYDENRPRGGCPISGA